MEPSIASGRNLAFGAMSLDWSPATGPGPQRFGSRESRCMIFLLGARDTPVDGVEDYCDCLSAVLRQTGSAAEIVRVSWADQGWIRALLRLRRDSRTWRGEWVVLQYNALAWS